MCVGDLALVGYMSHPSADERVTPPLITYRCVLSELNPGPHQIQIDVTRLIRLLAFIQRNALGQPRVSVSILCEQPAVKL